MFIFFALISVAAGQDATRAPLISYEQAVQCAGLSQAASEMEGGESDDGQSLYDAALYWSLAASRAAQIAGRNATAADEDQMRARIVAVGKLSARDAEAQAELQTCQDRAPDLG